MMYLLDVNVLFSLFWRQHVHHDAAQQWFAAQGKKGWCTCATTELGFARAFSNSKINPAMPSPFEALELLEGNKLGARHRFIAEDLTPAAAANEMLVQGYRQLTDAYLFGLCIKKRLTLVSFDTGLASPWQPGDSRLKWLKLLHPTAPSSIPSPLH